MTAKELANQIAGKCEEVDRVLRNDDVTNEVKYYFFGLFMAELGRICKQVED